MYVKDATNKQLVNARHVSRRRVSRTYNLFVINAEDRQRVKCFVQRRVDGRWTKCTLEVLVEFQ